MNAQTKFAEVAEGNASAEFQALAHYDQLEEDLVLLRALRKAKDERRAAGLRAVNTPIEIIST